MREKDLFNIHLDDVLDNFQTKTDAEIEKEDFEKYLKDEADLCYLEDMGNISDFSISEFVSYSNGKNRKPRKRPREITMIKYRNTTYYAENCGDIKPRKGAIGLDVLAMEALENTGIEPTVDNLVDTIKHYDEIKQRVRRYNRP